MQVHFKKFPATIALVGVNIIVFAITYLKAGTLTDSGWTLSLLDMGALFNPLTLDKEWYRIFTHMFLHGGIAHLAVNMYALYSVGREVEILTGTKKFIVVYFISGIAAALNSLYWSMFSIGVGASGAIFGVFGFSLLIHIFLSKRSGRPMMPVLINFGVFVGINLMLAKVVHADNAAHLGGLAAGMAIGVHALARGGGAEFMKIQIEYAILALLVACFFSLPRYQVEYYRFFQYVLAAEDSTAARVRNNLTDAQYLSAFSTNRQQWDSALAMLNRQSYLPAVLASDTFRLRRYIGLRKREGDFKRIMIERESYIYLDSVDIVQDSMSRYLSLDYPLAFRLPSDAASPRPQGDKMEPVKVLYDRDWVEIASPPAMYYRIGFRDSLGRWNGPVKDFYASGDIQMKGTYKANKREGIFIYYSNHHTYVSAGRYQDNRSVGKWETFHDNGQLASEVYYNAGYMVKNLWDSLGNQLVIDGNGKEVERYPNGITAKEGEYRNGLKEGYWYGRYPTGELHFEEVYEAGRLIKGKSRTPDGNAFVYDASSLFPMPENGTRKFKDYLAAAAKAATPAEGGRVNISFRVTATGLLTDLSIEESPAPALNERAKKILLHGPRWLPAKLHGHEPVDSFTSVSINFQ
jgi:membrane associated rhomboid family serine protease/antitoxin component YwqK of YwqJK toxin-antitoxin module